mmetsp:Transcript_17078/g.53336  ORF Transcript_17078/g.53336 Transcript_17078/m.53336 type:complete len:284 (-) Transcript_17078:175-1026(-)
MPTRTSTTESSHQTRRKLSKAEPSQRTPMFWIRSRFFQGLALTWGCSKRLTLNVFLSRISIQKKAYMLLYQLSRLSRVLPWARILLRSKRGATSSRRSSVFSNHRSASSSPVARSGGSSGVLRESASTNSPDMRSLTIPDPNSANCSRDISPVLYGRDRRVGLTRLVQLPMFRLRRNDIRYVTSRSVSAESCRRLSAESSATPGLYQFPPRPSNSRAVCCRGHALPPTIRGSNSAPSSYGSIPSTPASAATSALPSRGDIQSSSQTIECPPRRSKNGGPVNHS